VKNIHKPSRQEHEPNPLKRVSSPKII